MYLKCVDRDDFIIAACLQGVCFAVLSWFGVLTFATVMAVVFFFALLGMR
jgi:hypothetical protein